MQRSISALHEVSYQSVDDKRIMALIAQVRKGISSELFYKRILSSLSFSVAEWAAYLHLSERTMLRYRNNNKNFEPIQSEKILELTMLCNYGVDVFGNKANFDIWLNSKNIALGGIKPKELLDTSYGITLVKDELTRIEHGILA